MELVPLIVFGLYGGALADHFDRRLLLIWTGIAQAAFTAWLAINAFSPHPRLWEIFLVSGLLASASALQRPSREALLPRTVRHDELVAANALSSLGMQAGVLVGPAIGGVLVASFGPGWCFLVDIVGLFVASMLYAAMRRYPHVGETEPPSLSGIRRGCSYAMSRKDLLGTYVVDLIAMLLAMPIVLFPALAAAGVRRPPPAGSPLLRRDRRRDGGDRDLRLDLAGPSARPGHRAGGDGVRRVHRPRRDLPHSIWVALLFFALAGAADMISAVFRGTIWNQTIPDNMRGRMAGIEMLSYSVGPLAGQVRAGLRGGPLERPRRDHQRWRELCRRGRDHRRVAARLLVLRRAHRRARRGRTDGQAARGRARRPGRTSPLSRAARGARLGPVDFSPEQIDDDTAGRARWRGSLARPGTMGVGGGTSQREF